MKYFIIICCVLLFLPVACENNLLNDVKLKIEEEDDIAPVPGGNGNITITNPQPDSLTVNWTKATDDVSKQSSLEYKVVYSLADNIDTVVNAEENGTVARDWIKDIDTVTITGLADLTTYYSNVLVRDIGGNNVIYTTESGETTKRPRLYWADSGSKNIFRVYFDGSNIQAEVTSGLDLPYGIAIDEQAREIYWTDPNTDEINRSDIDGINGPQEIIVTSTGNITPYGIEIDSANNNIYWVDFNNREIYTATTTLTNQSMPLALINNTVITGYPFDLALDLVRGKIYWTEVDIAGSNDRIGIANLNGSPDSSFPDYTFLDSDIYLPTAIEFDSVNNMIYWTETDSSHESIRNTDINATSVNILFSSADHFEYAYGLALDPAGGIMYWTDYNDSRIHYANMNGSGIISDFTLLFGAVLSPYGIDLDL